MRRAASTAKRAGWAAMKGRGGAFLRAKYRAPPRVAELRRVLEGMVVLHQETGGAEAIAHEELGAEVAAQRDEGVEDALVTEGPGCDEGEEDKRGERRPKPDTGIAEARQQNPKAADRQEDEERGV